VVREIDPQLLGFFLRKEPEGEARRNEDRRIALAQLGYGMNDGTGEWIAADAVGFLVKRGDLGPAAELVRYISDPRAVEDMLIQRRYSGLWPQLEEIAGPHLEAVRKAHVATARRHYAQDTNAEGLQHLANALRQAGMLDEAIALRSKLPDTADRWSSADEMTGWAANNIAYALHEAGRPDDADRLFAMLNEAPMPKEYWRVSMKINRLELLVLDGKFDKALALVEPTAKVDGSPYADQLVRRLRYCTLARLDRPEEAAKYLPDLLAHVDDAPGPTIDGLLCAGLIDRAEEVALTALKNPDEKRRVSFEADFVRQLQRHRLTSDDPSLWQERWQDLRRRPRIASEFDRLGRDMPEAILPVRSVK
jgi:tetratricopeptide (TPR) repeat protein